MCNNVAIKYFGGSKCVPYFYSFAAKSCVTLLSYYRTSRKHFKTMPNRIPVTVISVTDLYIYTSRGEIVRNSFEQWLRDNWEVEFKTIWPDLPKFTTSLANEYFDEIRSRRGSPLTQFTIRTHE